MELSTTRKGKGKGRLIFRWTDWGLTALSAQTGYITPLKSMLQLKK